VIFYDGMMRPGPTLRKRAELGGSVSLHRMII
jgi:hypothetical protein